jgi:hypothetical protein
LTACVDKDQSKQRAKKRHLHVVFFMGGLSFLTVFVSKTFFRPLGNVLWASVERAYGNLFLFPCGESDDCLSDAFCLSVKTRLSLLKGTVSDATNRPTMLLVNPGTDG